MPRMRSQGCHLSAAEHRRGTTLAVALKRWQITRGDHDLLVVLGFAAARVASLSESRNATGVRRTMSASRGRLHAYVPGKCALTKPRRQAGGGGGSKKSNMGQAIGGNSRLEGRGQAIGENGGGGEGKGAGNWRGGGRILKTMYCRTYRLFTEYLPPARVGRVLAEAGAPVCRAALGYVAAVA